MLSLVTAAGHLIQVVANAPDFWKQGLQSIIIDNRYRQKSVKNEISLRPSRFFDSFLDCLPFFGSHANGQAIRPGPLTFSYWENLLILHLGPGFEGAAPLASSV